MNPWLSVALTASRVCLGILAVRALGHAFTLPRGRLRRRQLALGAVGLVGAAIRL